MKKKNFKQTLVWVTGVFVLFPLFVLLYNKITVRKNDGEEYFKQYYDRISRINIQIPVSDVKRPIYMETGFDHYKTGASPIGFKGLSGSVQFVSFLDTARNKYFRIYLFDVNIQNYAAFEQLIEKKELYVNVNKDDLENPKYGTKENPIPIFNFKGVKEPIRIWGADESGSKMIYESLEPSIVQYKHNVLTYLTYIMSKKDFEERFEKEKNK